MSGSALITIHKINVNYVFKKHILQNFLLDRCISRRNLAVLLSTDAVRAGTRV